MPLYRYVKAQPATTSQAISLPVKPKPLLLTLFPFVLMTTGLFLIISIVTPILYHLLVIFPKNQKLAIISPLPASLLETQQLAQVAGVTTAIPAQISSPLTSQAAEPQSDYLKASNWFPTAPISRPNQSKITHYTIDIPKLNINNAVVAIAGNDLKKSLVQYAGTVNPGEYGSPVIFGHSILRQFYNPSQKNPKRYISIFSTIMTLTTGDEIIINFDGIEYTYKVADKYEVKPTQIEVLQQRYDRQSLKLITCTPEGTYLRRGVIEAQLVQKT